MQIKDRVLGVIEVINRKDGLPFVEDDQNLLTAFAGQAAVAIENARLLALTDQELAARVEELSVMGRIVRELNASLEVDRAMRITLESAIRQSNAEAGLIGMLEDGDLRIMAQEDGTDVTFDPPQFSAWEDTRAGANSPWAVGWRTPPVPADNKWEDRATFKAPGEYVLRCVAHDGALTTTENIRIVVSP